MNVGTRSSLSRRSAVVAAVLAGLLAAPVAAVAAPGWESVDRRECFSRSELDTVHKAWHRFRVEKHTETRGIGVESTTARPGWVAVTYPACVTGQSVVVVYNERGRWMTIGRG